MNLEKIKSIIKEYNDQCIKANKKDEKITSSGKKKDDLIKDILNAIPDEEKQKFYDKIEPDFITGLLNDTLQFLGGNDKREKIVKISDLSKGNGITIDVKGLQWEESATIELLSNSKFFTKCSCRVGSSDGICRHLLAGFLILLNRNKITMSQMPLEIPIKQADNLLNKLKVVVSQKTEKDDADIVMEGEYRLFIDSQQYSVTTEWEGDYAGKKIKGYTSYEELENEITKQIAEKIIGNIKSKRDDPEKKVSGQVRFLIIDKFGIISKIFARQSLVEKISRKLGSIGLSTNEEEIYNLLIENLEINNNPIFSTITKIIKPKKKSKTKYIQE